MKQNHDLAPIIDHAGNYFVPFAFVDKIPASPPDRPVKYRLLHDPLALEKSTCVIVCQNGNIFVALKYLNKLLSSAKNARPLRVDLSIEMDDDEDQQLKLILRDQHGASVELAEPKSEQQQNLQDFSAGDAIASALGRSHDKAERSDKRRLPSVRTLGTQTVDRPEPGPIDLEQGSKPRPSNDSRQNQIKEWLQKRQVAHQTVKGTGSSPSNTALSSLQTSPVNTPSTGARQGKHHTQDDQVSRQNPTSDGGIFENVVSGENQSTPRKDTLIHRDKSQTLKAQGQTSISNVALHGRLLHGISAWKQLKDFRLTDFEVIQALMDEEFPDALSSLVDNPESMVPLFKSPNGRRYSVKLFAGANMWAPQNLGIPSPRVVTYNCELRYRSQLQELYMELRKLQEFKRGSQQTHESEDGTKFCTVTKEGLFLKRPPLSEDPKYMDAILNKVSSGKYGTLVLCKTEILRFIKYCNRFYQSIEGVGAKSTHVRNFTNINDPQRPAAYQSALRAQELAEKVYKQFSDASEREKTFSKCGLFTRLVRELSIIPLPIGNHTTPEFVLPLGRLCYTVNADDTPKELEDIVLMDIASPEKTLWRYHLVSTSESRCCSLTLLAENLERIGLSDDTLGVWETTGFPESLHESAWAEVPVRPLVENSPRHMATSISVKPEEIGFDRTSNKGLLQAIKQKCGPITRQGNTGKRHLEMGDSEDEGIDLQRASKRREC